MHPYLPSPKVVVVTGPRCGGKTHVAEEIARQFLFTCLSLDHIRLGIQKKNSLSAAEMSDPKTKSLYKEAFMSKIREYRYADFVIEGTRFVHDFVLDAFLEALMIEYGQYPIVKLFCLLPDMATRYERYSDRIKGLIRNFEAEMRSSARNEGYVKFLAECITSPFDAFYAPSGRFEIVADTKDILSWVRQNLEVVHPDYPAHHSALIEEIARSGSNFSPFYQTVDIGEERIITGQTKSFLTWENIMKLDIDWSGKNVIEIGCNNGYFLFKTENLGAKCVGYDINAGSIDAANAIKRYINSDVIFTLQDVAKSFTDSCDVLLALNMLHYIQDLESFVAVIAERSQTLVLEIGKKQVESIVPMAIKKGHTVRKVLPSHRKQGVIGERVILHLSKGQPGHAGRTDRMGPDAYLSHGL